MKKRSYKRKRRVFLIDESLYAEAIISVKAEGFSLPAARERVAKEKGWEFDGDPSVLFKFIKDYENEKKGK